MLAWLPRSIGFGYTLAAVAFLVLITRMFYPHHRTVALIIYALSWVPFVLLGKRILTKHQSLIDYTYTHYALYIVLGSSCLHLRTPLGYYFLPNGHHFSI